MRILPLLLFILLMSASQAFSDDSGLPQTTLFYSSISGIGAAFHDVDGRTVVRSLISDSPAEKAGVKPGDKILKVDGKSVAGMSVSHVIDLIRGPDGTVVKLVVEREGTPLSFSIKRELLRVRRPNSAVNPH